MTATRTFPHDVSSVTGARHFARETLTELPSDALDAVELMVSELATNSVKHANSAFTLTITLTGSAVRVDLHDQGTGEPLLASPTPDQLSGRGLRIVDMLSSRWGSEATDNGKSVWFELKPSVERRSNDSAPMSAAPRPR